MVTGNNTRRKLVVNADDFGWSSGVNAGIIECFTSGIVTSTSLLATGVAFDHAVTLAKENPNLGVGVHLNIYRGTPLLSATPVLSGSVFKITYEILSGKLSREKIEAEFRAQIEKVIKSGITPTHLDTEKHIHLLFPQVFRIVCKLATLYRIQFVRFVRERLSPNLRVALLDSSAKYSARYARDMNLRFVDETVGIATAPTSLEALKESLAKTTGSVVELVTHPGHLDQAFWDLQKKIPNKLTYQREEELKVLSSNEARELVASRGFELVNFGKI